MNLYVCSREAAAGFSLAASSAGLTTVMAGRGGATCESRAGILATSPISAVS